MPAVLGAYINAGVASLADGVTSFVHSLPSTPDFAVYQAIGSHSIPVRLETRGSAVIQWRNANGEGLNGEHFLIFAHSIIR